MSSDISVKSIAFMIDELITTCLKAHHFAAKPGAAAQQAEFDARKGALCRAIDERLTRAPDASLGALIAELGTTLIKCWNAQEAVMSGAEGQAVVQAAKEAQRLNAERNRLMREIDRRLGEGAISVTGKTYG